MKEEKDTAKRKTDADASAKKESSGKRRASKKPVEKEAVKNMGTVTSEAHADKSKNSTAEPGVAAANGKKVQAPAAAKQEEPPAAEEKAEENIPVDAEETGTQASVESSEAPAAEDGAAKAETQEPADETEEVSF